MYSKQITVRNRLGIHVKPASALVLLAKRYKSDVYIRNLGGDGDRVSAKYIGKVMGLSITQGQAVEISAEGPDRIEAVDSIVTLINTGFGEM